MGPELHPYGGIMGPELHPYGGIMGPEMYGMTLWWNHGSRDVWHDLMVESWVQRYMA